MLSIEIVSVNDDISHHCQYQLKSFSYFWLLKYILQTNGLFLAETLWKIMWNHGCDRGLKTDNIWMNNSELKLKKNCSKCEYIKGLHTYLGEPIFVLHDKTPKLCCRSYHVRGLVLSLFLYLFYCCFFVCVCVCVFRRN